MTTETERPVNSAGLRQHFDISETTMHRWIVAGCPHMRRGKGRLFFKLSEVEEWLRTEQVA